MTQVRFRDLTQEQKNIICNGCGGKGGSIQPPQFFFKASCNHHDFQYWLGHTEEHRKEADYQFWCAMKEDVSNQHWWKKPFFYTMAYIYYKAVRWNGKKFFYYGPTERTLEDLQSALKK